jgi:hypothetical protein
MDSIVSDLVARFEKGSLSRRELVQGLAMLAASGTAATAQEDNTFKAANIDHISVQVADLQRSTLRCRANVLRGPIASSFGWFRHPITNLRGRQTDTRFRLQSSRNVVLSHR